jgi:Protein of unknown function (DUF3102)
MNEVVSADTFTLPELAKRINEEHALAEQDAQACLAHAQSSLLHAKNAGDALILAKVQVGHGKFLAWIEANCTFSSRQAQRYMRVASRWNELEANATRVSHLSCRGALELLNQAEKEFTCPVCKETLDRELWHCPVCDKHLLPAVDACPECDTPRPAEPAPAKDTAATAGSEPAERSLLERLLPAPLAFFLSRGVITQEHVRLLVGIKDLYGAELPRDMTPWLRREFPDRPAVEFFLVYLRMEDHPLLWFARPPHVGEWNPLVAEACKVFIADARRRDGQLPWWEVAAFWWASQVVLAKPELELLGRLIRAWQERLDGALNWWQMYGDGGEFEGEEGVDDSRRQLHHGYRSELRHAGLLDRVHELMDLSTRRGRKVFLRATGRHYWPLPTAVLQRRAQAQSEGRDPDEEFPINDEEEEPEEDEEAVA